MPRAASAKNLDSLRFTEDLSSEVTKALKPPTLPDIVEFAESEHFCNKRLYPRQRTLLRLFYADVDHMDAYDRDVIEQWRESFYVGSDRIGVSQDIWERIKWIKD